MRTENTIQIETTIERAWELTLDVESWPDHTPTMTSIERLHAGALTPTPTRVARTLSVDLTGRFSRLVGAIVLRLIGTAITTENQGFKTAAEHSGTHVTPSTLAHR